MCIEVLWKIFFFYHMSGIKHRQINSDSECLLINSTNELIVMIPTVIDYAQIIQQTKILQ